MQEGIQDIRTSDLTIPRCPSSRVSIDSSGEDRITRSSSIERASNRSSWRRGSISLSGDVSERLLSSISLQRDIADQILGEIDGSMVAQVGDSGCRVLEDERQVEDPSDAKLSSPVPPLTEEIISPLPTDAILHRTQKNQPQMTRTLSLKEKQEKLPQILDHMCYLIYLAFFGILGAITRYFLQKLFGPGHIALTGDKEVLYLDLPSNMLGSFLMGWFGVVFKADIRHLSDHLAVGLTTGYLGSLTTFSGWIMKMLDLSARGRWVHAVAGCLFGTFLVNESIAWGVESGQWLRRSPLAYCIKILRLENCRLNAFTSQVVVMALMLLTTVTFWGFSMHQTLIELGNSTSFAILWLGCLVGAPGVWARWYLARLNGEGLGRKQLLKWFPIGTLCANVIAACLMAALSTLSKAVNTKQCALIVGGVQFGFLGCLSTVSTFMAEVYAMRQSGPHGHGRAFAYILATILLSFVLGTFIFSVPVWTKHYH